MKSSTARELERLLAATPAGQPPPGLAERIKSEIPDELEAPALSDAPPRPVWQPHRWRLAAALLMVIGGGALGWWTIRDAGMAEAPVVATAEAERADASAGKPELPEEAASVAESTPPAPAASEPPAVGMQAGGGPAPAAPPRPERQRRQPTPDAPEIEPQALHSLGYLANESPAPTYAEEIVVTGKAPVIDTTSTTAGATYSGSLESELPISRTFTGPAYAAPGVVGGAMTPEGNVATPSTGGTDEPNDAPYGDVFFRHYIIWYFLGQIIIWTAFFKNLGLKEIR
jgi:hypothetical protein